MAREIAINIYLFFFGMVFKFFNILFPTKNKVVHVVSFSENSINIYKEWKRQEQSCRTIFLLTKSSLTSEFNAIKQDDDQILQFTPSSPIAFLEGLFHLATTKIVLVDNYYGFLANIRFKTEVKCYQLWHANGAIKRFGLRDPSNKKRSKQALIRFQKVYKQFHQVIVGSDKMKEIFKEAFNLNENHFLPIGIPRTDVFFHEESINKKKERLLQQYPELRTNKLILYAPTFRDENLETYELKIDLELLYQDLRDSDYLILLKLHPAIRNTVTIDDSMKDFVYDFSHFANTNELLFITDILVTDYSSIPFEFSLLNKPMIFYPYDLNHYKESRGFWTEYKKLVPGPVVSSTNELIEVIRQQSFDYHLINTFNHEWNTNNDGKASYRFVKYLQADLHSEHKKVERNQ